MKKTILILAVSLFSLKSFSVPVFEIENEIQPVELTIDNLSLIVKDKFIHAGFREKNEINRILFANYEKAGCTMIYSAYSGPFKFLENFDDIDFCSDVNHAFRHMEHTEGCKIHITVDTENQKILRVSPTCDFRADAEKGMTPV